MEINDFKTIWKKANDQEKSGYWVSDEDVRAMLKKKSNATIADVKKELKNKVRMTALFGFIAASVGLLSILDPDSDSSIQNFMLAGTAYGIILILMSLAMFTISYHAKFRLSQVIHLEQSSGAIKSTLKRTRQIFDKIINAGVLSDTIVTPIVLILVVALKVYEKVPFAFDVRLLYLSIATIGLVYAFYYLSRFVMKRKFGHFARALDSRIAELEALETEDSEII